MLAGNISVAKNINPKHSVVNSGEFVMKADKVLCQMFLLPFLTLTLYKTQLLIIMYIVS